jgi:hypothetical protein
MFSLTNLVLSGILLLNSVAVLNEERFLARSRNKTKHKDFIFY